jgi:hypothetical protein
MATSIGPKFGPSSCNNNTTKWTHAETKIILFFSWLLHIKWGLQIANNLPFQVFLLVNYNLFCANQVAWMHNGNPRVCDPLLFYCETAERITRKFDFVCLHGIFLGTKFLAVWHSCRMSVENLTSNVSDTCVVFVFKWHNKKVLSPTRKETNYSDQTWDLINLLPKKLNTLPRPFH